MASPFIRCQDGKIVNANFVVEFDVKRCSSESERFAIMGYGENFEPGYSHSKCTVVEFDSEEDARAGMDRLLSGLGSGNLLDFSDRAKQPVRFRPV